MNGMKIQRRKMGRNLDEYKFDLERERVPEPVAVLEDSLSSAVQCLV